MTNTLYRPAVAADFENLSFQIEEGLSLSMNQVESISAGELDELVEGINTKYGVGRDQLKTKIWGFANILKAKADFEAGKPVYVSYN